MLFTIPECGTAWGDKQWAEEQIQRAQTLEQLQAISRFAIDRISSAQRDYTILLSIFMLVTLAAICFLIWALLIMKRIEREESDKCST